ncbi:cache domain-containing protein [Sulfurimonas aquatica]|nr:cache domain-containing protein [Sulfurimonas aquatica]
MLLRNILILITFILLSIVIVFFAQKSITSAYDNAISKFSSNLLNDLQIEERYAQDIGFVVLTTISENPKIINSLKKHDRSIAIKELNKIVAEYKAKTNIKNLKIHIHTADMKSFIRHWKLNKYGDDLSGFRKTVVKVHDTKESVFAFEIGRIGLTLRTLLPIEDDGVYLGSIEFIQQFNQVPAQFEKHGNQYLLLMDKSYLNIAKYLTTSPDMENYKVSSKYFNKDFLEESRKIDFNILRSNKFYFSNMYMFVYKDIIDVNNNIVGMHLLAIPSKKVNELIENDKNTIMLSSLFGFVIMLLILLLMYFMNKK